MTHIIDPDEIANHHQNKLERIVKTLEKVVSRLRSHAMTVEIWNDMMADFLKHDAHIISACVSILKKMREEDAEVTGVFIQKGQSVTKGSTGEFAAIDSYVADSLPGGSDNGNDSTE